MKNLLIICSLALICGVLQAQVTVSHGNSVAYQINKDAETSSFSTDANHYFIFNKTVAATHMYSMLVSDRAGNVNKVDEIAIKNGVFNNAFYIYKILGVGKKAVVLVQHLDKNGGKNTLLLRTMDNSGAVSETEIEAASLDYKKMMNPGDWYVYVTPDHNHLAIVGRQPLEKDQPDKFTFAFFDSDLKKINSGEFTFPLRDKKMRNIDFYASDKGDLYLVNNDYEKGAWAPEVFRLSVSNTTVTSSTILLTEPQKIFNYVGAVTKEGNLVIGGYYHENKKISIGETAAKGTWIYDSGQNNSVKTSPLDNPIENLTARSIFFNGNTAFLVGEQYKEDKTSVPTPPGGTPTFNYNYTYDYKDMVVTGYDAANWNKKFNVVLNRNWTGRNYNDDLPAVFGILNGKFTAVYNDEYTKYFPKATSYSNTKLPVLVSVTNDGLMEEPVNYETIFRATDYSGFTLMPKFSSNEISNDFLILGYNRRDNYILGHVFKAK
jgi:hypothetical protein